MGMYLIAEGYWSNPMNYVYIAEVVLALGFVIFVHELGHFLAAKACSVKVEKFYVGFDFGGLKIFSFKYGETEYGLGLIPLGGYVKMLGQDDNPANYAEEMERTKIKKQDDQGDAAASETEEKTDSAKNEAKPEEHHESAVTGGGLDLMSEPKPGDEEFEIDPRSYPARPVWQRMIIISAGVIMNLIFAVIFATFAYMGGVKYTPTLVRATAPGGAAWKADVPLGGKIVRIGEGERVKENLRFMSDLMESVIINGSGNELSFLIRTPDGKDEEFLLAPQPQPYGTSERPSLGVVAPADPVINDASPAIPGSVAALVENGFEPKDEIISVSSPSMKEVDIAGVPEDERFIVLQRAIAAHNDEPITFNVKRTVDDAETTASVVVPPAQMKRVGLITKVLPISAIQKNSPAEAAGMKVGDKILKIAGEDFVDSFLVDDMLRPHYNSETIEPIEIIVSRDGESVPLQVTLRQPRYVLSSYQQSMPWFSDALGAAWPISNEIVAVEPESSAAKAGLKAGDRIASIRFYSEKEKDDEHDMLYSGKLTEIKDDSGDWAMAFDAMQSALPSTIVEIGYNRDDIVKTVDLKPTVGVGFYPQRGILFNMMSREYYADGVGEAFVLGLRETKEKIGRIVTFLYKLVTGQLAVTNLGGPLSIGFVATSEASQGWPRLLLFLTLLSANLAVVNFLPIPVLDGGHFVLLMYEGITGKPPAEKYYMPLMLAGLAFIVCLMIFVFSMDIVRFTGMGG